MSGWWMRLREALGQRLPSGFGRNALVLAGSTAAGQGLLILASPLLTRLYSPEDFGAYGIYLSLLSLAAVVVAFRYELAVPVAESEDDAFHLTLLAVGIVVCTAIVVGVVGALWGRQLAGLLGVPRLAPLLWLLGLGVLALGLYNVLSHWVVRARAFTVLGRTRVHKSVGQLVAQVGAGLVKAGAAGLLVGDIVGRALGSAAVGLLFLRGRSGETRRFAWGRLREVACRYRGFPLLTSPGGVLYASSQALPPLALSALYGPEVAGFYVLAERVLDLPVGVVGEAVSQVYLGEAASLREDGIERVSELHRALLRMTFGLGSLLLVVSLAGPVWVPWVFGAEWAGAGTYIAILSVVFGLRLPAMAVARTYHIARRLDLDLYKELLRASLVVVAFLVGGLADLTAGGTVLLLSAANAVGFGGYIVLASAALRRPGFER